MPVRYPKGATDTAAKMAHMQQRICNSIKIGNLLGRWFKYHRRRWYVLDGEVGINEGWAGSDLYHCNIVSMHPDQSGANKALLDMGAPPRHFVASPGLARAEYDTLPPKIRAKASYSSQLSAPQWALAQKWLRHIRDRNQAEYNEHRKSIEAAGALSDPTQGIGAI